MEDRKFLGSEGFIVNEGVVDERFVGILGICGGWEVVYRLQRTKSL